MLVKINKEIIIGGAVCRSNPEKVAERVGGTAYFFSLTGNIH